MAKDLRLYLTLAEDLGVATLVGPGTLTAFQFAHTTEAREIAHLRELREAGRLTLTGQAHAVGPGIRPDPRAGRPTRRVRRRRTRPAGR
jgi:hypothetical protein